MIYGFTSEHENYLRRGYLAYSISLPLYSLIFSALLYYPQRLRSERSTKYTRPHCLKPHSATRIDTSHPMIRCPDVGRRRTSPLVHKVRRTNWIYRRQETRWIGGANPTKYRSNLNSTGSQESMRLHKVIGHFNGGDSLPRCKPFAAFRPLPNSCLADNFWRL